MVTFSKVNSPTQCRGAVQIGYIAYTNVLGDCTVVLAEALEDGGGCVVQLRRIIATHINVVNEQLSGMKVHDARENLSQRRLACVLVLINMLKPRTG